MLFGKAVQETILDACDLDQDLVSIEVDRSIQRLFWWRGAGGFVESLLSLYVFYSVWFAIHDVISARVISEVALRGSMKTVRLLSDAAVSAAIRDAVASGQWDRIESDPAAGIGLMESIRTRILLAEDR